MEVTKVLLEHGSQVDPVNSDGQTPLHLAAVRGDAETCQLLVSEYCMNVCFVRFVIVVYVYIDLIVET